MQRVLWRALARAPLLLMMLLSSPSLAAPAAAQILPLGEPEFVSASSGAFAIRDRDDDEETYEAGWEVRFAPRRFRLLPDNFPDVIPVAGAMAGSRSILYVYGGLRLDLPVGDRWMVSPGWAAGLYYQGHGMDLGNVLEFRSHIEVAYLLSRDTRVGLCLYHLSNAGIADRNPGSESVVLTYSARLR